MKYTLKSSTTKVALQHMSKKTLYELIRKLGKSFSNTIDTPDNNIDSIMRYYAVGAFNHVEIIEQTIRDIFNEIELKNFDGMLPIKNEKPIPQITILKSGYYLKWVDKKKWELFTNENKSTNIFVIGRSQQLERKLIERLPNYSDVNISLDEPIVI